MRQTTNGPSVLTSLLIMSVMMLGLSVYSSYLQAAAAAAEWSYVPEELRLLGDLGTEDYRRAMESLPEPDHITSFYRDPLSRGLVIAFFSALTGSDEIAVSILDHAMDRNIEPALAFALVKKESDFKVDAFNRNADSIDRGLFQLNSKSFPKLTVKDFYTVQTNVRIGMAHLDFCLDSGGNEVKGLAMYNAGTNRVSTLGTPARTLDYIYDILGYRDRIEALFEAQVVARYRTANPVASTSGLPRTGTAD